jgi:MSHA pilin protein MshA
MPKASIWLFADSFKVFRRIFVYFFDINQFRIARRAVFQSTAAGFTLIELVMVIAIIGILASLAVPKFLDMSGAAKQSAAKAGLGSLRSVLAIRYAASATGGVTASYPTALLATDFAGGDLPKNALSGTSGVTALTATTTGTATNANAGYWYVSLTSSADYGKAGAYSDGSVNTSAF